MKFHCGKQMGSYYIANDINQFNEVNMNALLRAL